MESKKWENKLKLWLVLHPEHPPLDGGQVCQTYCPLGKKRHICINAKKKLRQGIYTGKIIEIDGKDYKKYHREQGWHCIEWIRHV